MPLSPESSALVRSVMARHFGLDFPESRTPDLDRAVERTFPGIPGDSGAARLATLPPNSQEMNELVRWLTVGETYFFRDEASFNALEFDVLPQLIAERRATGDMHLRLWSAGCSTGEEAYSFAILLDRLLPDVERWDLTILATDLNPYALAAARRGRYRPWALRDTPPWIQLTYFHRTGSDELELDARIRSRVTFGQLNLVSSAYPGASPDTRGMDVIFCRNVLMYFTRQAQAASVERLRRCLVPGGWLATSPAEASSELFTTFRPVSLTDAIFYRDLPEPTDRARPGPEGAGPPAAPSAIPSPTLAQPASIPERLAARVDSQPKGELSALGSPPTEVGEDLVAAARHAADQGDLALAKTRCEAALARDPLSLDAHLLLADVCLECGDQIGARTSLQRAIFLEPRSATAHFALGSLLLREGSRAEARRPLEAAIRILESEPISAIVPGTEGLTAGRITELASALLDVSADSPATDKTMSRKAS